MKFNLTAETPPATGPLAEAHRKMRQPGSVLPLMICTVIVALLPLIPGVSARLGVTVADTALAMGVFSVVSLAAAGTFWLTGASRAYWRMSVLETWVTGLSLLYLVWASGEPLSPFWILYLCLVLVVVFEPVGRWGEVSAFLAGPLLLVLAFWAVGEVAKAALAGTVGAVAIVVAAVMRSLFVGWVEASAERDRLRAEVAELRLAQERTRISRDLHDGLGTELASLTWAARTLQQRLSGTAAEAEVGQLLGRLRSGMDELRSVVWALRSQSRSWDDLVTRLTERCHELGGEAEVVVDAECAPDAPQTELDGPLALDVLRAVQELVHNAARHGRPRRIHVELRRTQQGVRCKVSDDGPGLPAEAAARSEGGLRNVRARVDAAGGQLTIESDGGGTRISLYLPAPTAAPNMSMQ